MITHNYSIFRKVATVYPFKAETEEISDADQNQVNSAKS